MTDDYTRRDDKNKPNETWLVQRLNKPWKTSGLPETLSNVFAFGGGLKNGGLSKDAMTLLKDIFEFDYMGSAEFEWGSVPNALRHIAENIKDYFAYSFDIALMDVANNWKDKSKKVPEGSVTIYMLVSKADYPEFEKRIRQWARESYNSNLKESTHLSSTLRPYNEWDGRVVGWLELNNGFMFFTDKEMWQKTCDLFGVHHE